MMAEAMNGARRWVVTVRFPRRGERKAELSRGTCASMRCRALCAMKGNPPRI